jgi:hypothetical protein
MKLQRCQFDDAKTPDDFRSGPGACGDGIYAMMFGDKKLQKYYSARGEQTFSFEVPDNVVKKIGGIGVTSYQAIKERVKLISEDESNYSVFICKHGGINVPAGKQIIITDRSVITNIQKI